MDFNAEILEKLSKLQKKYEAMGQDLSSYLDGLLYANPLDYWDYIKTDALLSLQQPRTDFPDEKIFIVYHQITELYFNLALHELEQIANNGKDISEAGQDKGWKSTMDASFMTERLRRVNKYFEALTKSFDIMVQGMEKEQFLKFRMSLLPASGFQSAQYRMIEISATDLFFLVQKDKRDQLKNASLEDQLENLYWKQGAIELESGKKTLTLLKFEEKYQDIFLELAKNYETKNMWRKYEALREKGDADDALRKEMRQLDVNVNINWPLVHYKSAVRYLNKSEGDIAATGGTNWQKYLPPRFQKRIFYPELWSEKEQEEWGKAWVEEVMAHEIKS